MVSPAVAVKRYPDATFVVAIWHPSRTERMMDRMEQLRALGASNVIPFYELFAEYGNLLLPNLFWERPDYYAEHTEEIARGTSPAGCRRDVRSSTARCGLRLGDFSGQIDRSRSPVFSEGSFPASRTRFSLTAALTTAIRLPNFAAPLTIVMTGSLRLNRIRRILRR